MSTYTYEQIANNFELWQTYADPNATMSKEEFDELTAEERENLLTEWFGKELVASDGTVHPNETELADYEEDLKRG